MFGLLRHRFVLSAVAILIPLLVLPASAATLKGCLSPVGQLYNVAVDDGNPTEEVCSNGIEVRLGDGDVTEITAGKGLVGGGISGGIGLDLAPNFRLPEGCLNGEVPVADGNGGWRCIEPGSENLSGKLWVIPRWVNCPERPPSDGGRPELLRPCSGSLITFMNPGGATAVVTCYFFNHNGALLLDAIQLRTLSRGGLAQCYPPLTESVGGARDGWALLSSDQNILPTVEYQGLTRAVLGYQTEAHPIDCDDDTGYEFVCTFAKD